MYSTDLYVALVIGVVLSLIYAEVTGTLPSGLIVPGYLALYFDQPLFIALILLISLVTFLLVKHGLARFTILYGRRMFTAMLLTAIVLKLTFDYFYPMVPFQIFEVRGIGVVVPGLIANTIQKQGVIHTFISTVLLSGITFLIMLLYYMI
ncbi:MAG: poly-gamma-glutamate biosynthesis protein PgsC [Firmicutes bacterium]|nr:poly-gamma-glutamate biosynthesis protein PgsC [Bacillota bacterium]